MPHCNLFVVIFGQRGYGGKQIRIDPNLCVGNQLIAQEHDGTFTNFRGTPQVGLGYGGLKKKIVDGHSKDEWVIIL